MAKKRVTKTTPFGRALYPKLFTPDTKFKADGEYSIKLRLTKEEAKGLIAFIDKKYDRHFEDLAEAGETVKTKNDPPYQVDSETGDYILTFKMPARIKTKKGEVIDLKPKVFDAANPPKPITSKIDIGSGSIVRVSFWINEYNTALGSGLTLKLQAVQIKELVEYTGPDGSSFGFDAVEGGFEADSGGFDSDDAVEEDEEEEDFDF